VRIVVGGLLVGVLLVPDFEVRFDFLDKGHSLRHAPTPDPVEMDDPCRRFDGRRGSRSKPTSTFDRPAPRALG
jgi:hypothetical protein